MLICFNDVCKYNANCRDCLFRGDIILDDEGACNCFEDYSKQPEYQTIFFKACSGDDGKLHKVIAKGRKTTEGCFTLYYETKDLTQETYCTEEKSGVCAPYKLFRIPEHVENIKQRIASLEYGDVKDLPYKSDTTFACFARKDVKNGVHGLAVAVSNVTVTFD